jgi:hypothetical protein
VKVVPILFAIGYVGRREWGKLAVSVLVAAALWAPALQYDLEAYPSDVGPSLSLLSIAGLVPWLTLAMAALAVAIRFARTRYAGLAAAVAVVAAVPRLALYDLTYLLVWRVREDPSNES